MIEAKAWMTLLFSRSVSLDILVFHHKSLTYSHVSHLILSFIIFLRDIIGQINLGYFPM